jgi:mono/diheme cytochrome c family protein
MRLSLRILVGSAVAVALSAAPAIAQEAPLDADIAAGKLIFEETAGGVGCASCHGIDGYSGDVGIDLRGKSAGIIINKLRVVSEMREIELTRSEIDQVAAYLRHLRNLDPYR